MGAFCKYLLLSFCTIILMSSSLKAQGALISSSFHKATSSDTFVTEPNIEEPTPAGTSKGYNTGPAIDYNKIIANKLFPNDTVDKTALVLVDTSQSQNKVKVGKDRVMQITLSERVSHKWLFEYDKMHLEIVKQSKEGQDLVVQFRTKKCGTTKIYLDYLDKSNHGTKVIGSKVVLITIGK